MSNSAYDLAERLVRNKSGVDVAKDRLRERSADKLIEQAERIEELEKELEKRAESEP